MGLALLRFVISPTKIGGEYFPGKLCMENLKISSFLLDSLLERTVHHDEISNVPFLHEGRGASRIGAELGIQN